MISPEVTIAVQLLKNASLTIEERLLLTAALLDKLGAIPTRARIAADATGRILIDGQAMSVEKATRLRSSARSLLKNFARNFVQNTIEFMAVKEAIHNNTSSEQALFAKAIFWQHHEEQELYLALAGSETGSE